MPHPPKELDELFEMDDEEFDNELAEIQQKLAEDDEYDSFEQLAAFEDDGGYIPLDYDD